MRRFGIILACTVATIAAGCGSPVVCTLQPRFALRVEVTDGGTGEPLLDALATARDGAFVDSARTRPFAAGIAAAHLARSRPGIYDLTVERAGFTTFQRLGIEVRADACGVVTEEIPVQLMPS